ncbi:MAG: fumarylacetoacetate hydrolase family protein [Paraglaciecola sp.]|uniref:fumarylacetoacetate hydrolase family protein n=1 Tax=Paraglaciecola sp. TaxID=1920173 RepID=UPI0032989B41
MKIVVFGDERRVGLQQDGRIIDINKAVGQYLADKRGVKRAIEQAAEQAPCNLAHFIEAGDVALDLTEEAAAYIKGNDDPAINYLENQVVLHAPWARRRIACAGVNFAKHVRDGYENFVGIVKTLEEVEKGIRSKPPMGFFKVPFHVQGPDEDVVYPGRTKVFDYEVESALIFGKRGADIKAAELPRYIWGVTMLNDWSTREMGPEGEGPVSFNLAKNFDSCCSMGPCIVVREGLDPANIDLKLTVNGETRQNFNSGEMEYSFGEYVEHLSKDFSFVPGDVLSGGTQCGTAADSSVRKDGKLVLDNFLRVGDVVEISSPQIGTMRNRVVAKQA